MGVNCRLDAIDRVETVPDDFEPFKNWRIHPLKGIWAVTVYENRRIIFCFVNSAAEDLDYH